MRILYVVPFVPWSIRVRSFNLIPRLARRHCIDLVCLASSGNQLSSLNGLGSLCGSVRSATHSRSRAVWQTLKALPTRVPLRMAYAFSAAMQAAVRDAIEANPPDVIYVERWRALSYIPSDSGIPVLCDPTDSMILYNRRLISNGSWWERVIGVEEYAKFLRYEPALSRRADLTVFCSTVDQDCLLAQDAGLNCEIVPNGVDCRHFFARGESEGESATIILTGNFHYRPNRHAAVYFLQKVLPSILRGCPAAKLLIVGNEATRNLGRHADDGTELIDFVPDLRPYLARASVAVAPLTVGVGVSNKVLQAFAVGTPVVATSLACGDLPVRDGEHLYVADSPEAFADRVLEILRNRALHVQMVQRARTLVATRYDWEVVSRKLEGLMHQLAETKRSSLPRISVAGSQ